MPEPTARRTSGIKVLPFFTVVGVVWFWGAATLASFQTTGYHPLHDTISEMAAVGANRAGVVTGGFVMLAIATGSLARVLYAQRVAIGGDVRPAKLLGLAAIGVLGAAVFPCDDGCPGPLSGTFANFLHGLFSAIAFVSLAAAMIVAYRAMRTAGSETTVRVLTLLALALALPTLLVTAALLPDRGLIGLTQRLALLAQTGWMTVVALRFM